MKDLFYSVIFITLVLGSHGILDIIDTQQGWEVRDPQRGTQTQIIRQGTDYLIVPPSGEPGRIIHPIPYSDEVEVIDLNNEGVPQ